MSNDVYYLMPLRFNQLTTEIDCGFLIRKSLPEMPATIVTENPPTRLSFRGDAVRFLKAMFADVVLFMAAATVLVIPAFAQHNKSTRVGLPQDWSHHYVVFTNTAAPDIVAHPEIAKRLQNDPRFLAHVINSNARRRIALLPHDPPGRRSRPAKDKAKIDWSIPLGAGTVNLNQFPAKYTTDVTLFPDCVHDFIVYPVNVAGSSAQPNIVGLNYLYSGGTTVGAGLCNSLTPASPGASAAPNVGSLADYSAAVYFSYNVNAIAGGGAVLTSPVISLDGSKVAFVESAAGKTPHFHVLAFNPGDGVNLLQPIDVETPVQITSFVSTTPTAGEATDLDYTNTGLDVLPSPCSAGNGNSNSSPYVDYANDVAYVGDDCGNVWRIKNVFCPNGCSNAAPGVDTSYDGAGDSYISTTSCGVTTSPVVDFGTTTSIGTGDVFMGCSNGKMYKIVTGGAVTQRSAGTGAISDPPLVDSSNGFVYWTNPSNGTGAILAQSPTVIFGLPTVVAFGQPGVAAVHAGTFNDPYFDSATASTWAVFVCGFATAGSHPPELFSVPFTAGRIITTPVTGNSNIGIFSSGGAQCSPITEFLGGDGFDRIFFGINSGTVDMFQVGTSSSNTFTSSTSVTFAAENGGTSGIVVDNNSNQPNASSFYFATLSDNTAVKLTDSGLQ